MERQRFTLTNCQERHRVALLINSLPLGTRVEVKGESRTDRQNRAIHGLIGQILKQRPVHRGIEMTMEAYKAALMHGLGRELDMIPSLDGRGMVPLGLSTSALTVSEFNQLIEFTLAWAAQEGLTIQHFDGSQEAGSAQQASRRAAA